ncbi:ATP-dependent Clp protease ATP-binding subunit [Escherichia coli]|uniref:ATP-dependent Clp protease ATP-binding subunit n=1 Tax=Escherichia coli TaxID=562 RepID=A0A376ZQU6_ECOLX|nr:ATP-dependent Clp protease ATP-binding subunit [Escherichia coli]
MIHQVVDKFIVELQVQLDQKGVSLEVSQEARNWLAEKGYDRAMGARPMARVIQDNLKKTARQRTAVWFAGGRRSGHRRAG